MKILNMQLKGQEREVVVVVTLCCKHQAMYNPFYSYLLQKLAAYDRKFKVNQSAFCLFALKQAVCFVYLLAFLCWSFVCFVCLFV